MPLAAAAKTLPRVRGSKPPHPMTLYRWATNGLKAASGRRVFLETEFVGGTRITSIEALERFFASRNDCDYQTVTLEDQRQEKELRRGAEQATTRLRECGMLD